MGAITVSPQFKADFEFFCERAELSNYERGEWRNAIRADFATVGTWVTETVAVYRFCDEKWPLGLPTARLCEGHLASLGWYPQDDGIFKRWGIMLLVRLCAEVSGVVPRRLVME